MKLLSLVLSILFVTICSSQSFAFNSAGLADSDYMVDFVISGQATQSQVQPPACSTGSAGQSATNLFTATTTNHSPSTQPPSGTYENQNAFGWESIFALLMNNTSTASSQTSGVGANITPSYRVNYESDMSKLRAQLKTPTDVSAYMTSNFSYTSNPPGGTGFKAQSPEQTNETRLADCKAYATFVDWALSDDGYDVKIGAFRYNTSNNYGHVVAIINGGTAGYTSNNRLFASADSLESIGRNEIATGAVPANSVADGWRQYNPGYRGDLKNAYQ